MSKPLSESEWEREIKRDELRISRYFQTLPLYLDLPGEDDYIFNKLRSQKELAPSHGGWSPALPGDDEDGDEVDALTDQELVSSISNNEGFALFRRLEQASQEWNIFSSIHLDSPGKVLFSLNVAGCYGKLLSRLFNFVEIGDGDEYTRALKESLGKRVLADFDALANALAEVRDLKTEYKESLGAFIDMTGYFREEALKIVLRYNHSTPQ